MAEQSNKSVARNKQYRRGGLTVRQRHNERQNDDYQNEDIIQDRSALNVHFKQAEDSYIATFDKMIADGVISTRGLGKDPFVVDELVFDVNTAYFDNGGGYEYAKSFFEEAYKFAVKEIGGEQFVLSAVMHADERNRGLSEELGRDVYHYHLHVVYVPVVDKEIYFKKNNKDPEKAGKLREVIKQVSHSKKWPKLKQLDENGEPKRNEKGKTILVNAYSLLQDHYHEHMREAGFLGFERGERGSTAENLTAQEYKTQQEKKRAEEYAAIAEEKQKAAAALDKTIAGKTQTAAELDAQTEKKQKQLEKLDGKTAIAKKEAADFSDIDAMPKKTITGNVQLAPTDWQKVSGLAKEGVKSRGIIAGLKKKIAELFNMNTEKDKKLKKYEGMGVTDTMQYYQAKQKAPRRLAEIVVDILRKPPEQTQPERTAPDKKKSHGMEL